MAFITVSTVSRDGSCTTYKSTRLTIDRTERIPMKISYPMLFSSLRSLIMEGFWHVRSGVADTFPLTARRTLAAGNSDHVLARHNLDALPRDPVGGLHRGPFGAEGELMGIEFDPTFPRRVFDATFVEEIDDGLRVRVLRRRQGQPVLQQEADCLQRVTLGVADQPHGPAL